MDKFGISDYDHYWENRFNEAHYQFTDVHRKIIEEARKILGERRALVLDCGVGPGHVFKILSRYYDTYGIEISEKAFELYNFNTDNIAIWDLNNGLPDYSPKMDLIIASRIIHHLEEPILFLKRVRESLKHKGWFMGVIPNICYYHHRLKFLVGKFPPISKAHLNFQTGADFKRMVMDSGFRFLKLTTPKKTIRAKLWPTVFSQDLIYVFQKK
jgi:SAM-dependent methyltransferase